MYHLPLGIPLKEGLKPSTMHRVLSNMMQAPVGNSIKRRIEPPTALQHFTHKKQANYQPYSMHNNQIPSSLKKPEGHNNLPSGQMYETYLSTFKVAVATGATKKYPLAPPLRLVYTLAGWPLNMPPSLPRLAARSL